MLEDPTGELDAPFSSPAASATSWTEVDKALRAAEIFWLATVRPDGRPHTTPLIGAWLHGALYSQPAGASARSATSARTRTA